PGFVSGALGFVGLGVLLALALLVEEGSRFLYQGGFAVTALATAALIVALSQPATLPARALSGRVLRWLGTRSYAVYLWHWPLLLMSWPAQPEPLTLLAQAGGTLVLAEASYRFVESPARRGALGRAWQQIRSRQPGFQPVRSLQRLGAAGM